ncbi:MAG: OmpH family outer membrane protein [Syntrophaceae bacterium]|jgi:outer membrane protein|nr:OmpH family outer membrane protein [Syntrophaceae bacterium]HQM46000.1 OmpH family outer membrane protein [Smithellaceae bacterium]
MKKMLLLGLSFLMVLVLSAPAFASDARIGVIDLKKILRDSKAAKKAQDVFRKDLEAKRATVAAKQKEIQTMEEQFKKDEAKMTQEARQKAAVQLAKDVRELKITAGDMEEELKRMDRDMTQKIVSDVMKVVNDYTKKGKYTIILERSAVLDMDATADITDAIIKLYDAKK